ncbi:MAG: FtsX-like permease family protein [Spirochaetaceae bacterium]|jgi:ABC-type lipoprotein release transport system permease subunit|nr:FtsX-like permease family protein [Spirochaetaceae bacterium]
MTSIQTGRFRLSAELPRMAFRNLARHRVKTVLTVSAVTMSVALYIFADGWLTGMNLESIRNIVCYEIGAAKLQKREYFENKDELPMYENFDSWRVYADALHKGGYASAPRFVFQATIYTERGFAPVIINAVEPEREERLLRYTKYIEDGRYINPGGFEIVIGSMLAKKLIPEDGNRNVLISTVIDIKDGGVIRHVNQLISAVIVGVVNSPDPQVNYTAFIPLDVLQDEAGLMLEGRVTELLIRKQNPDDGAIPGRDETEGAIRAAILKETGVLSDDLDVFPWRAYVRDYFAASASDDVTTRIMLVILFILSLLGIANTVLLAILERTKEIGMLRALGMTDGELILMMTLESGFIGMIGSAAGIVIGCLINIPMVKYGIDFSGITEAMNGDIGYRITGAFRSAWNIPVILCSGLAATALSACMAYFPARRALKMPVTESLRFE